MSEAKVTLTREGVEKLAEHFYDGGRLSDWQQIELLHIAISALSQEAVRDGALEEVAQMAQDRAASEHDDFSEFAHDVRALKREPNAAAESYESAHPKALDEPAPAAPYVDRFYGPQDPGFWAAVSDRRFSNEYIGIALRGWLDAQSPKDARSLR